ncbi:serine/threonine-protein kinase [Shewanella glacialimarina]|uniref:serine/threonine-protein kinase n=1 Tax=Shewanella glacialimarina TaxID=2590884 RepID=UPI001CF8E4B3|nr:serine/threonine-protein kinase [Shewanella glacialimarina]UCX04430.1 serine/threonine protein kinase [Shewanella glacialimarina]
MDKSKVPNQPIDDKTFVAGITQPKKVNNEVKLIGKCFKQRYLIETKIGHGGMSDIYRAKDLYLESLKIPEPYVAIKVLLSQFSNVEEAQQVLIKESVQTQQLSHPNIIRVYDVDTDDGYHFMVMEWLDGETLEQVIKRSKPLGINFNGTIKLVEQIASALSYAHQQGIVHTDLKPSNVFLTRQGNIKIFDFGVAKSFQHNVDQYALAETDHDSSLTGYTPAYASFEQLAGEDACAADDIFAFSCIVYELLTSKHPYQRVAANEIELTKTKLIKPKHISLGLWLTLKKGLAIKKAQRVDSVKNIIDKFQSKSWPITTAVASVLALTIIGVLVQLSHKQEILALQSRLVQSTQAQNDIQAYEFLPASSVLARIEEIPSDKLLIRNGLLRKHQKSILDTLEQQIESLPKSSNGLYQDYKKIESMISNVSSYYPDSVRLLQISNQAQRSKQSVIDSLSERLTVLLSQSRYNEEGDNNIQTIIEGLAFIEPEYQYSPSEADFNLYSQAFATALKSHNVKQLNTLIITGEVIFSNQPLAKPLIEYGSELRVAVRKLSDYNDAKAKGLVVDYPYSAAEVYYRDTFNKLTIRLDSINEPKTLHAFDQEVRDLATNLPEDFEPLLTLDKRLAASFLRQANIFLDKQYLKTARELFARGNEMYERLNGVQRL